MTCSYNLYSLITTVYYTVYGLQYAASSRKSVMAGQRLVSRVCIAYNIWPMISSLKLCCMFYSACWDKLYSSLYGSITYSGVSSLALVVYSLHRLRSVVLAIDRRRWDTDCVLQVSDLCRL